MAKYTITFEDDGDMVKTDMNPTFTSVMEKLQKGEPLSSAGGYWIACVNKIREINANPSDTHVVKIPKLKDSQPT